MLNKLGRGNVWRKVFYTFACKQSSFSNFMYNKGSQNQSARSNLLLVLTAIIWGFAFVAQRAGMEHVGPFTYNGIRFLLGSLSLLPLYYFTKKHEKQSAAGPVICKRYTLNGGFLAGVVMFFAASFQQVGIVFTTAGKAGFITGLYVIFVPFIGMLFGQKTKINIWIGAVIAVVGLYFLSISGSLKIALGDMLVLISALFFAVHILIIGYFSKRVDVIRLSLLQFTVCSFLSLLVAVITESFQIKAVLEAALPIIYGGIFSVGIAYTLQVSGQKHAHPSSASIILSLESLFAAIGGWLILGEKMTSGAVLGCILMLTGMILAQISFTRNKLIAFPLKQENHLKK